MITIILGVLLLVTLVQGVIVDEHIKMEQELENNIW